MKKGDLFEGIVDVIEFPNKGNCNGGWGADCGKKCPSGSENSRRVDEKRKGKSEGRLLTILEPSPVERPGEACEHFGICGGACTRVCPMRSS